MSTYQVVVFVHVLAAVVLMGGSIGAAPSIASLVRHATTIAEIRRVLHYSRRLAPVNPVAAIVLLASGLYLAEAGSWWRRGWVWVAVALWVMNLVLATRVVRPSLIHLGKLIDNASGETISGEVDAARRAPGWARSEDLILAGDLAVLFMMIAKPTGYLAPAVVLVVAALAVTGFQRLVEVRTPRLGATTAAAETARR